jgi:hypothetical protein
MKSKRSSDFIHSFCLLACLLLLHGCGTVRLEVPPGHNVRLLEQDEYASIRVERTLWFWLWGGRPISDNSTVEDIQKHQLKEIRLQTEQTMTDSITTVLLVWSSIARRTMIIEGNPDSYQKSAIIKTSAGEQQ